MALHTLLLFDIDGTLVRGSRAARVAFARAIETCLGVSVDLSHLKSDGQTDLWIMREIISQHGLDRPGLDWDVLIAAFLDCAADAVRLNPGEECPGARTLLEELSRQTGVVLALGTGNLERSARMKLAAHDLDRYFETGGFGGDGTVREAVIVAGVRRAEKHYRVGFDRVVVIGDTPFDAAAAATAGVWSLCVATGPFDLDTLRAAGATLVFSDLTATEAVVRAISGLPASAHRL